MRLNPEIRRNLWLEFSTHRLIAMPVVLAVIFYVAEALQRTFSSTSNTSLEITAGVFYFLLIKIWGGHKAAESVIEEVNDNTWDFQKLSSQSPWQLTVGKLFGSTAYAWYGGLMAYVVMVYAASSRLHDRSELLLFALGYLVSGLTVHAMALFSSLVAVQARMGARGKLRALPHHVLGLIVGGWTSAGVMGSDLINRTALMTNHAPIDRTIAWFGRDYDLPGFLLVGDILLLLWIVAGIYWLLRGQIRMRTGPWLWLGFVVFWDIYISGFDIGALNAKLTVFPAFMFNLVCLYVVLFREPWTSVTYRRVLDNWQSGARLRALELCPRWLPTFVICLLLAIQLAAKSPTTAGSTFLAAMMLFMLRDVALLHFFKFDPASKRAEKAALFYLAVLYLLLPAFLFYVVRLDDAARLFWPATVEGMLDWRAQLGTILSAGCQALLVGGLALRRWHDLNHR